jgi:hypothetical protein
MHGTSVLSRTRLIAAVLIGSASAATACAQGGAAGQAPQFGPGVLTTIPPELDRVDGVSVHDVVEIRANERLQWQPSQWLTWTSSVESPTSRTLYEMAQDAAFLQDVWALEFSFKPLRMIEVDVPQNDGRVATRRVMYMVYRVRNTGAGLSGAAGDDGAFKTTDFSKDQVRFIPEFVLSSQNRQGPESAVRKAYLDRLVPAAMAAIERREMGGRRLLNSVDMAQQTLPIEDGRTQRGLWGVAMWEDVDPELDFFSIYVGGLTNAYKWDDPEGAFKAGDPPGTGREFARKKLQLNFWRPGDERDPDEGEFRFGVAPGEGSLYDAGEGVAHQWVYR